MCFDCSWIALGKTVDKLDVRSVHDQVSRNGFGSACYRRMTELLRLQNYAEFFAELYATMTPIAPITPLYSVENTCTPGLSRRLLTDRL